MATILQNVNAQALLTRTAHPTPLLTTLVPSAARRAPGRVLDRIDPKGITTIIPRSKIAGDPNRQLFGVISQRLLPKAKWGGMAVNPAGNPWKRGVYEKAGGLLPIRKERASSTLRRQSALRGHFAKTILADGPKTVLGRGLIGGIDLYRGQRVKPALPNGIAELPAATRPSGAVGGLIDHISAPRAVFTNLANEGRAVDARISNVPWEVMPDDVSLSTAQVVNASEVTDPKPGPNLLLVAGVVVLAFMVMR